MDKVETGKLIKEARIKKQLTQTELGELLGVTNKAISRWENGDSFPDVSMIENISSILDIKIQDIITGKTQSKRKVPTRVWMKYSIAALFLLTFFLIGFAGIAGKITYMDHSIGFVTISFCISEIMILLVTIKQKHIVLKKHSSYEKLLNAIILITFIWTVLLPWAALIPILKGMQFLGMENHRVGPFITTQFKIIFIIHMIYLLIETYYYLKEKMNFNSITLISVATIYMMTLWFDYLFRMSEVKNVIPQLIHRTGIVVVILGIFEIGFWLLHKK